MRLDQLRQAAKDRIDGLAPDQLKVAAEFLRYLDQRASEEATAELLRIAGMQEDIEEAEREFAQGKGTPADKLRRKY